MLTIMHETVQPTVTKPSVLYKNVCVSFNKEIVQESLVFILLMSG